MRYLISGLVAGVVLSLGSVAKLAAQIEAEASVVLQNRGASVQPVYEGFERNTDGSFTMWFGYMNRNHQERPHIPVGPNNYFQITERLGEGGAVPVERRLADPGPQDRGQPTHFYNRRQNFVFSVRVPSDFGDQDLVWTVNHHGEEMTAIGSLGPAWVWALDPGVWQANRYSGGFRDREGIEYHNDPPTVEVRGASEVSAIVGEPVAITVHARDPDRYPGPGSWDSPDPDPFPNTLPSFLEPTDSNIVHMKFAKETGLAVTFLHYRGAGEVRFSPQTVSGMDPDGDEATTRVTFSEPGTYVIRAYADDGIEMRSADVKVVVADE